MQRCAFFTVATDALVLKQQAISIPTADYLFLYWNNCIQGHNELSDWMTNSMEILASSWDLSSAFYHLYSLETIQVLVIYGNQP